MSTGVGEHSPSVNASKDFDVRRLLERLRSPDNTLRRSAHEKHGAVEAETCRPAGHQKSSVTPKSLQEANINVITPGALRDSRQTCFEGSYNPTLMNNHT